MYLSYGLQENTDSPKYIHIFDLETHQWDISDLRVSSQRSFVASGKAGTSFIIANGSVWGNWAKNDVWVIDIDT